jgi:hypothetical protein
MVHTVTTAEIHVLVSNAEQQFYKKEFSMTW